MPDTSHTANRLIREKSPYLLQHAYNPVDWYPWGAEAFEKARREDKPIFLSVGYSTCHWCHVMERESFESQAIARILNEKFVAVKVDREERPDVDRIYMLFVQATTGGGGWPMSVWLTPDLKPFYGGTYFPPDNRYGRPGFAYILEQISRAWGEQREQLLKSGDSVLGELERYAQVRSSAATPDAQAIESAYAQIRRSYDSKYGGFGGAPKFPRPSLFNFLFRYHLKSGNAEARDMALHTLREMAKGGMNDQLGGGFHRYSVDERWFVPHFEKMLYDQAQLAISYLEAFQVSGDALYADVACGIFDYVLRDLTHPDGPFYSAEDADSVIDPAHPHEKGEGAFYIWSEAELEQILGPEDAALFGHRYGVEADGNVHHDPHQEFTGRNILYEAAPIEQSARRFGISVEEAQQRIAQAAAKLLDVRTRRPRPHLDDKVLAGWNGLMISAFAKGAQVLEASRPEVARRYREAAERAAGWILTNLYRAGSGVLMRRWREGEAAVEGFLDDYAFLVHGLLDLYEANFDAGLLLRAVELTAKMLELFEDREHGGFFSTSDAGSDLVLRLKEDYDGAEPSGNSIAILNLLRLAQLMGNAGLNETAQEALKAFGARLNQQPVTLPQMLCALLYAQAPKRQIVIAGAAHGEATRALLAVVRRRLLPDAIVILADPDRPAPPNTALASLTPVDGKAAAYVCQNFTCRLPVTDPPALDELLQ